MAIQVKLHPLFYGGISTDSKVGFKYSHAYSRALDFRKKPGRLCVLPGSREIGDENVVDLIQNIVQVDDGNRYALGDAGWLYRIDSSNVVTPITKLDNGAAGLMFRRDTDEMYVSSLKTVSRYGKFSSGILHMEQNKYKQTRSEDSRAYRTSGTSNISLNPSINETKRIEFTPDIEPLYSIKVKVNAKGTGDWTATIHDDANNSLGTSTVVTASIPNSGLVEFIFSTPVRMLVKPNARTYHIHITSSDGTGSIVTSNNTSINTADFEIWADRLVSPNNGLHPIEQFLQYTVIGNERYLSAWEPLSDNPSNGEWRRHRLTFPSGYEVCGLAATDEFLAIATERKGSTSRDYQDGKLFLWDGLSETYNQFINIPEGSPKSIHTFNNIVYMIVNGALYAWPGGKNIVKLRTISNTDSEYSDVSDTTDVYPNMMTVRRNTLLIGYPSTTTNVSLENGIYSWGRREESFPMTLGLNYSISTGTRFNTAGTLKLGCVKNFGDTLYYSWKDGTDYGLDVVDNTSDPAISSSWESLEFDAGDSTHEKTARSMSIIVPDTIPSGYTITPKYRTNWSTTWTYGSSLTEDNEYRMDIDVRFKMIEYGFDLSHTTATAPLEITGVKFVYDNNVNEKER